MNPVLIGEGSVFDVSAMEQAEATLPEGSDTELRLFIRGGSFYNWAEDVESALVEAGVPLLDKVKQVGGIIKIRFRKGFPWLPIIAVAILFLAILIVSWQLLRWVSEQPAMIALLFVGGIVGILALGKGRKRK